MVIANTAPMASRDRIELSSVFRGVDGWLAGSDATGQQVPSDRKKVSMGDPHSQLKDSL
jgi:hypothetical protein